jgi:dTMP kinase
MKTLSRGILIALEGIDGSGKSVLANKLYHSLKDIFPTALTKEPGGTALGKQLRSILQNYDGDICPRTEFLLFAADRPQHFHELIIPALQKNMLIISDRLADSAIVYQGYGRSLDIPTLQNINRWAMQNSEPDLVFYISIDVKTALARFNGRGKELTRFEQEQASFFEQLLKGYAELFKERKNVIILDGHKTPEALADEAKHKVLEFLKQFNTPKQ